MKNTLLRLLVYILIIECWYFVLLGRGPRHSPPPDNTLAGDVAYYFGAYAVRWGFWIVIYESVYQAFKYAKRRKHKPVPDTQPLSAVSQADNPTQSIDK